MSTLICTKCVIREPLSSPQARLPLLTPLLLLSITQACHCDAAASVVIPESLPPPLSSLIPRTCCLFPVLCRRLRCRR